VRFYKGHAANAGKLVSRQAQLQKIIFYISIVFLRRFAVRRQAKTLGVGRGNGKRAAICMVGGQCPLVTKALEVTVLRLLPGMIPDDETRMFRSVLVAGRTPGRGRNGALCTSVLRSPGVTRRKSDRQQ
jgi:hypothetical protein